MPKENSAEIPRVSSAAAEFSAPLVQQSRPRWGARNKKMAKEKKEKEMLKNNKNKQEKTYATTDGLTFGRSEPS